MPSSPSANSRGGSCNGRFPKRAPFGLWLLCACAIASAQIPKSAPKNAGPQRANELTLAGLRPGRDTVAKARAKFGTKDMTTNDAAVIWTCADWRLTLDLAEQQSIRSVTLTEIGSRPTDADHSSSHGTKEFPIPCYLKIATPIELEQGKPMGPKNIWTTGRGVALENSAEQLIRIYGPPDSKSPSSKGGQQLELWYYAFDWAGPDVPQVMEVLCTKEKDGTPGKVIEITLAAPSL